jgi:hydrogenase maturation protease
MIYQGGENFSPPFFFLVANMSEKNYITILGLGNILLQDEGFGVHFVRWFEKNYQLPEGVGIVEGGTLGYKLLDTVCSCDKLLVIDVIKSNEPGSIYRFTKEEIDEQELQPTSAHEVSFQDVLCKAELIEELPDVIFLCIVPYEYKDMGLELTPLMVKKMPEVEKLLLQELSSHGINLLKLNNA